MKLQCIVLAGLIALLSGGSVCAQSAAVTSACQQIGIAISPSSDVYYPPDENYYTDIAHYATSSTENAVCSVEPGTAEDVGAILSILRTTQTPFAVKGGGHIMNPGHSATTGVQIAMSRFDTIEYDPATQTVAIGAGLVWDDVYSALEEYGVTVVGGRVTGVGVAGYTLGGGYSWLTNQYGLTLDTVQGHELVLPNGTVVQVTESSDPDLFFGLKGGYNNFGIVTNFRLKTFPQEQVWGGQRIYLQEELDAVTAATTVFYEEVTDPKAALLTTYDYTDGGVIASIMMFYDAPSPPAGIFDNMLAIPAASSNVSTRSYLSLIQVEPTQETANLRGYYNTVPLMDLTSSILQAVVNQTSYWGQQLDGSSVQAISYDVEPFLSTILTHGGPSAYPPTRTERFLPLNIYFAWSSPADDADCYNAIVQTAASLTDLAMDDGQFSVSTAPRYPNYAIYDTSLVDIYGDALSQLAPLKVQYDPDNVMGLAGGWKL